MPVHGRENRNGVGRTNGLAARMRMVLALVLSFVSGFAVPAMGQGAAQVLITGVESRLPSPYVDTFEQAFVQGRYRILLTYTSATPSEDGPFRMTVRLDQDGAEVAAITSEPFDLPAGTYHLNTFQDRVVIPFAGLDRGAIGAVLHVLRLASTNGMLEEGSYTLGLDLEAEDGFLLGGSAQAVFQVFYLDPPELLLPMDEDVILTPYPEFSWLPVQGVPAGTLVNYDFRLVEVLDGQPPQQAIDANRPWAQIRRTGVTQIVYTPDRLPLVEGMTYAWQVTASAATGSLVFLEQGRSEIFVFTFEPLAPPVTDFVLWPVPRPSPVLTARIPRTQFLNGYANGDAAIALGSGSVEATFEQASFSADTTRLVTGQVRFKSSFALSAPVDVYTGRIGAYRSSGAALLPADNGLSFEFGFPPTLTPDGLRAAGGGRAFVRHPELSNEELEAFFSEDFRLATEPFAISAGRVELVSEGDVVAVADRNGLRVILQEGPPSIVEPGQVPDRLPVGGLNVAYVTLRRGETVLVDVSETDQGLLLTARPGAGLQLTLPMLSGSPSIPVQFDGVTVDPQNTQRIVAGLISAEALPEDDRFHLTGAGTPLALARFQGSATGLAIGARIRVFGQVVPHADLISMGVDAAGNLFGSMNLVDQNAAIRWAPGHDNLRFVVQDVTGSVDGFSPLGGTARVAVSLSGEVILEDGSGSSVGSSVSLQYVPGSSVAVTGFRPNVAEDPALMPLGSMRLAVFALSGLTLHGGDGMPEFSLDLASALRIPLEGTQLGSPLPGVQLRNTGMVIPQQDLDDSTPGFAPAPIRLGPVRLELLSLRLPRTRMPWFGAETIEGTSAAGQFRFDFDVRLPDLAARWPSFGDISATLLDARYEDPGILVGSVVPYTLTEAARLAAGKVGVEVTGFTGRLLRSAEGRQAYDLSLAGRLDAAGLFANAPASCTTPVLALALQADGRLTSQTSSYTPCGSVDFDLLRLSYSGATLALDLGGERPAATLFGTATATLAGPSGAPVTAQGSLTLDLITGRPSSGSIPVNATFAWRYPKVNPFLDLEAGRATFSAEGLLVEGSGRTAQGVGLTYDRLLIRLPDRTLASGQARFTQSLVLRHALAGDASWRLGTGLAPVEGDEAVLGLPSGAILDARGLSAAGPGGAGLRYGGEIVPNLTLDLAGFVLALQPRRVSAGQAEWKRGASRIAYLDRTGFHYEGGALAEVPARIGLPTVDIGYLEVDRNQVESLQIGGGLEVRPLAGAAPSTMVLVGFTPEIRLPVAFDRILLDGGGRIAEGELIVTPSPALSLTAHGLPLSLESISYRNEGEGYRLAARSAVLLPDGLDPLRLEVPSLAFSSTGILPVGLGTVTDRNADADPVILASHAYGEGLFEMTVQGLVLQPDSAAISGILTSSLFRAGEAPSPAVVQYWAKWENESWQFRVNVEHLALRAIPLDQAFLTPDATVAAGAAPLRVRTGTGGFALVVDGIFSLQGALGSGFAAPLVGFAVGPQGIEPGTVPTTDLAFRLFGGILNLRPSRATSSYTEGRLRLTLSGAGHVGASTDPKEPEGRIAMSFEGLTVDTRGTLGLPGDGNLLSAPLTIIEAREQELMKIDRLAFETVLKDGKRSMALRAEGQVRLPKPFGDRTSPMRVLFDGKGDLLQAPVFDFGFPALAGEDEAFVERLKAGFLGTLALFIMKTAVVDVDLKDLSKSALYAAADIHLGSRVSADPPIQLGVASPTLIRDTDKWGYKADRSGEAWQITNSVGQLSGSESIYNVGIEASGGLLSFRVTQFLMASQSEISDDAPFGFQVGGQLVVSFTKKGDGPGGIDDKGYAGAGAWTDMKFDTEGVIDPGRFGGMILQVGGVFAFEVGGIFIGVDKHPYLFLTENITGGEMGSDATESSTVKTKVTTVEAAFYLRFASSISGTVVTDNKFTQAQRLEGDPYQRYQNAPEDFGGDALKVTIRGPQFTGALKEILIFVDGKITTVAQNVTTETEADFYLAVQALRMDFGSIDLKLYGDLAFVVGDDPGEFEASVAGAGFLQGNGGGLAGTISTLDGLRMGLFFLVKSEKAAIPIVPYFMYADEVGGGFFWRPRMADFERILGVLQAADFKLVGPEPPEIDQAMALGLLYGGIQLGFMPGVAFAEGAALLQVSDQFSKVDLNANMVWDQKFSMPGMLADSDLLGFLQVVYSGGEFRRLEGGIRLAAKYGFQARKSAGEKKTIEETLQQNAGLNPDDYDPSQGGDGEINRPGMRDFGLKFVDGQGDLLLSLRNQNGVFAGGIRGALKANILTPPSLPPMVTAEGTLITADQGVFAGLSASRSFPIIPGVFTLSAGVGTQFWYYEPESSFGLYLEGKADAQVLGGLAKMGAKIKGALLYQPTPDIDVLFYAAGQGRVKIVGVFEGKIDIYMAVTEDGFEGGEGGNGKYEAMLADAQSLARYTNTAAESVVGKLGVALEGLDKLQLEEVGRYLITDKVVAERYKTNMRAVETTHYGSVPPILDEVLRMAIDGQAPEGETWSRPSTTAEQIESREGDLVRLRVANAKAAQADLQPRLDALRLQAATWIDAARGSELDVEQALSAPAQAAGETFTVDTGQIAEQQELLITHQQDLFAASPEARDAAIREAIASVQGNLDQLDVLIQDEGGIRSVASIYRWANESLVDYYRALADYYAREFTWSSRTNSRLTELSFMGSPLFIALENPVSAQDYRDGQGRYTSPPLADRRRVADHTYARRDIFHRVDGSLWDATQYREALNALAQTGNTQDWLALWQRRRDEGLQLYAEAFRLALRRHALALAGNLRTVAERHRGFRETTHADWAGFTGGIDTLYTQRAQLASILYGLMSTYDQSRSEPFYTQARSAIVTSLQAPVIGPVTAETQWSQHDGAQFSHAEAGLRWTSSGPGGYAEASIGLRPQNDYYARVPMVSIGPEVQYRFAHFFDYGLTYDAASNTYIPNNPGQPVGYDVALRLRSRGGTTRTFSGRVTMSPNSEGAQEVPALQPIAPINVTSPEFPALRIAPPPLPSRITRAIVPIGTNVTAAPMQVYESVPAAPPMESYLSEAQPLVPEWKPFVTWSPAESQRSYVAGYTYRVETMQLPAVGSGIGPIVASTGPPLESPLPQAEVAFQALPYDQAFRLVVQAVDAWGNRSREWPTHIFSRSDPSPPEAPIIRTSRSPSTDAQRVTVWMTRPARDPETGIRGYQFAVGTSPGSADLRPWPGGTAVDFVAPVGSPVPSFFAPLTGARPEAPYWVSVRAVNQQTVRDADPADVQFSAVVTSGPVLIADPTPPEEPAVSLHYDPVLGQLQVAASRIHDPESGIARVTYRIFDNGEGGGTPVAEGTFYARSSPEAEPLRGTTRFLQNITVGDLGGKLVRVDVTATNASVVSASDRTGTGYLSLVDETPPVVGALSVQRDASGSSITVTLDGIRDPDTGIFRVEAQLLEPPIGIPVGDWIDVTSDCTPVGSGLRLTRSFNTLGRELGVRVRVRNVSGLRTLVQSDLTPPPAPTTFLDDVTGDDGAPRLLVLIGGLYDPESGLVRLETRRTSEEAPAGASWTSLFSLQVPADDTRSAPGRSASLLLSSWAPGDRLDLRLVNGHGFERIVTGIPLVADGTPPILQGFVVTMLPGTRAELAVGRVGDPESGLARLVYDVIDAEPGGSYGSILANGLELAVSSAAARGEIVSVSTEIDLGAFVGRRIQLRLRAANRTGLENRAYQTLVVPASVSP